MTPQRNRRAQAHQHEYEHEYEYEYEHEHEHEYEELRNLTTNNLLSSHGDSTVETVISLQHVTKRFGRCTALDDVSLAVPPGVVFALLGENGAGKTTAIRILLGLAEPTGGTAHVLGLDSRTQDLEIRRRVGYVSEQPTLYDWMTVAEIGWFAAGFHARAYLDEYQRITQRFHLPEGQKLKSLSKGMRAKVALSFALAHDQP